MTLMLSGTSPRPSRACAGPKRLRFQFLVASFEACLPASKCWPSSVAQGWDASLLHSLSAVAGAQQLPKLGFLQSMAHDLEGPLLEQMSFYAARGGHLEVLQWLCLQGAALSPQTCTATAEGGHLAVLQYAHQKGCAWIISKCATAANGGHLTVLQYAPQNGCAWGPKVCCAAAQPALDEIIEVLKWARLQQPPCPLWSCWEPIRWVLSPCMLVYLLQQQAPMTAPHIAQARAHEMTYAVLTLRAALPDRTPHELVLKIVSLGVSQGCCCWANSTP